VAGFSVRPGGSPGATLRPRSHLRHTGRAARCQFDRRLAEIEVATRVENA